MSICSLRNMCNNFNEETIVRIYARKGLIDTVLLLEDVFINIPRVFYDLDIYNFEFKENDKILEIYY